MSSTDQPQNQTQTPEFTLENIKQAINLLYSNQNPEQISIVNKFLQTAQRSKIAWDIAFVLIEDNESIMTQHYGASTLTEKIRYHFNEIPQEMLNELRDKILEKIVQTGENGKCKIITTKLCVALASLASQMIAKDIWTNVVQYVVENLLKSCIPLKKKNFKVLKKSKISKSN